MARQTVENIILKNLKKSKNVEIFLSSHVGRGEKSCLRIFFFYLLNINKTCLCIFIFQLYTRQRIINFFDVSDVCNF